MSSLNERIEAVLAQIRPAIQMDGGDVKVVEVLVEKGIVVVHMSGACQTCPMSQITLKMGIEATLKDAIPEITEVVSI